MSVEINILDDSALELDVKGTVAKHDYESLTSLAEARIEERGSVSLLVDISEMRGYSPRALWEDLKFDAKHYRDVARIALVARDPSKRWLARLARPFTRAEVQFYNEEDIESARQWVTRTDADAPVRDSQAGGTGSNSRPPRVYRRHSRT